MNSTSNLIGNYLFHPDNVKQGVDLLQKRFGTNKKNSARTLAAATACGAAAVFIWNNWSTLSDSVSGYISSSVTINNNDSLAYDVVKWLAVNVIARRDAPSQTAYTESPATDIDYFPGTGKVWFFYERRLFVAQIEAEFQIAMNLDSYETCKGNLTVTCLGNDFGALKSFLQTCRSFRKKRDADNSQVSITTCSDACWNRSKSKPLRPMHTVHLDEEIKMDFLRDVERYLNADTKKFYQSRGIPYRRGYLLYGPPGTGKTSLCMALAGHVQLPLYVLSLPSVDGDNKLTELFEDLPDECIVLMEDIDGVRMQRDKSTTTTTNETTSEENNKASQLRSITPCTLSGLLNVLDGVGSQEGRIVIMTANEPERLDKALIRPGRIDKKVYMGHINKACAALMFERMFASENETNKKAFENESKNGGVENEPRGDEQVDNSRLKALAEEFSRQVPEDMFTPAQLQEYMIEHVGQPERAVEGIGAFVELNKATNTDPEFTDLKKER